MVTNYYFLLVYILRIEIYLEAPSAEEAKIMLSDIESRIELLLKILEN